MKKKALLFGATLFLALPMTALASGGLIGDCADCHTMHNSFQGQTVAVKGINGTATSTPIMNLLKMDCVACHANNPTGADNIIDMANGSAIPQVMHNGATDLAGGNFSYVATNSRKGHNVVDLGLTADTNVGTYGAPPGKYRPSTHGGAHIFSSDGTDFDKLTCAGYGGCHGVRNQTVSHTVNTNISAAGVYADQAACEAALGVWNVDGTCDGADFNENIVRLVDIPAVSGAHHASFDGLKNPTQITTGALEGADIAAGYRFIPGLKGTGNEVQRWQNVDASNHNEYFGSAAKLEGSSCGVCHINATTEVSSHIGNDSTIKVPNQSMSGFCGTCHGAFHSAGAVGNTLESSDGQGPNGVSGAFLRHPSDYVIPNSTEYAAYTVYDLTAPVARPDLTAAIDPAVVTPGTDMVMCLSCHQAHGSDFNSMLRFDYASMTSKMVAGSFDTIADAQAEGGCLACHTTKGVLPENR